MSTTALPTTTTQRKIKVNLTESKQQENVDDQQHHISVGLIIDEDTNNNCDESIQPTISEGIETLPIKEQPTRNNMILDDDDDEQCEPTNILTIVDEEVEKTSLDNQAENQEEDKTPIIETKIYEKPVKTPRFEELIIEEEEPVKRENVDRVKKPSSSSPENNNRKSGDELLENDKSNDSEFSLMSVPSKVLNFFEKMIISNKGRIEMMKSLGNLMYFGSKTRTDVDVENEISDKMSLLNDIYETEKISTVISVIGWYQDYVSDKHKLQNKRIQSDSRFSPYHRAGQYLRLLECFILLVEIIFKKRSTYGENGKKNYWNLLIMTEVVKALIKLLATSKSKTNAPLFLNYNMLPPDEQASNIPMASFLPVIPKYSPFDKEASSMDKFANNYKNQAKPKFGSRSGRQIPSSDQLMAVLKSGNDDVPTTSQLGEQLGLNIDNDKLMLLAPQTEELKGSLGKILMYISDTLYSLRPVVYSYLLSKHGFKSWIPFIVSLLIELASIYLTRRAIRIVKKDIKEKSPSVPPEVGSTIEEELNRRTSSLSHYLYRGPLFEIVMERILKSILLPIFKRIPLIGASFVGYIEYIIMIQQFYFFCNPSV